MIDTAYGFESIDLSTDLLLKSGEDMALFEKQGDLYTGHYFFTSRGKSAFMVASDFIDAVFNQYGGKAIKGLTPLDNVGALRLTTRLGFSDYGTIDTVAGYMRLSILTKEEHNERNFRRQQEQAAEL